MNDLGWEPSWAEVLAILAIVWGVVGIILDIAALILEAASFRAGGVTSAITALATAGLALGVGIGALMMC